MKTLDELKLRLEEYRYGKADFPGYLELVDFVSSHNEPEFFGYIRPDFLHGFDKSEDNSAILHVQRKLTSVELGVNSYNKLYIQRME